jgi:hypothetical protein
MKMSGEHHASAALTPGKNPEIHRIGGYVSPWDGLDVFGVENVFLSLSGFEPRIIHSVA